MAETIFLPQIIGQPQNQVVAANELAGFSVIVADPRSLTYQWRFNNANMVGVEKELGGLGVGQSCEQVNDDRLRNKMKQSEFHSARLLTFHWCHPKYPRFLPSIP